MRKLMEEYGQERYDEGYEKGIKKGIKKGYAEGANNEKWKIAKSLLTRNISPEDGYWRVTILILIDGFLQLLINYL